MRVVVVATSYPAYDGDPSGHFVRADVARLERAGHEVRVVAPGAGGAFGWPGVAARVKARPWRAVEAAAWVGKARAVVAKSGAERIVAHWAVPSALPIATPGGAARAELEVVSHGGDVRLLAQVPRAIRSAIATRIAERASVWTFVSEPLAGALLSCLDDRARARVEAVARIEPAPIELPDVAAAADALRTRRFGVAVGRLVPGKRFDRAIDYAAAAGMPLVVVGDGPERARLEARARAAGGEARFVGRVDRAEALAWIAAADVLFHASVDEGLSTVVREAEALGTRVARLT